MNEYLKIAIVCPLSSNIKSYDGCVFIEADEKNMLDRDSEIFKFQIRTISKDRLIRKIGGITKIQLTEIKIRMIELLTY